MPLVDLFNSGGLVSASESTRSRYVVDGFDEDWAVTQAGSARSLGRNQESSSAKYNTTFPHPIRKLL
jgi:hypothetical protein